MSNITSRILEYLFDYKTESKLDLIISKHEKDYNEQLAKLKSIQDNYEKVEPKKLESLKYKKLYKNIPQTSIPSSTLITFAKRVGYVLEVILFYYGWSLCF